MAGRPTKYKDEYCRIAYQMALLGAIDKDLAKAFDVNEDTINEWKKVHPEFSESIKKGKIIADGEIADRLHQRAKGYEHEDLYITQYQGEIIQEKIMKHYPPDTTAAIFWLKNRQPAQWRDKTEISQETIIKNDAVTDMTFEELHELKYGYKPGDREKDND